MGGVSHEDDDDNEEPGMLSGATRRAEEQGWLDPSGKVNRDKLAAECDKLAKEDPQVAEFMARCLDCGGSGIVPGDPPSSQNPHGDPPEQCPRGCEVP